MELIDRDEIALLTVGVRYEKSFRIGDISGHLCDMALRDSSSPFGSDFFPRFQELSTQDRMLINNDRGYFLRITTSDLIFQYTINPDREHQEKEIKWFIHDAFAFIVEKLIHENHISRLQRVGFMISHIIDGENLGGNVISHLTSGKIKKAEQFTLRFGNKDATADGLTKHGVDDYVNHISTIKQTDENKYDISLDYQYYFIPQIADLKRWNATAFFERAFYKLDNDFYPTINPLVERVVETV